MFSSSVDKIFSFAVSVKDKIKLVCMFAEFDMRHVNQEKRNNKLKNNR